MKANPSVRRTLSTRTDEPPHLSSSVRLRGRTELEERTDLVETPDGVTNWKGDELVT